MPMINSAVKMAIKPLPRAISPNVHAVIDYLSIATFFISAGFFWRRNKRAALGALIGGGAELALSLLTDYADGVEKIIDMQTHREIDIGLGAMTATMPDFLAFDGGEERKLFLAQGAILTAVAELTDVPVRTRRLGRRRAA